MADEPLGKLSVEAVFDAVKALSGTNDFRKGLEKLIAESAKLDPKLSSNERSVDRLAKQLKALSPEAAAAKMQQLAAAVEKAGASNVRAGAQFDLIAQKLQKLKAAGAEVPASLKGIETALARIKSADLGGAIKGAAGSQAEGLAGSLGSIGSVLTKIGPAGIAAGAGIGLSVMAVRELASVLGEAATRADALSAAMANTGSDALSLQEERLAGAATGKDLQAIVGLIEKTEAAVANASPGIAKLGLDFEKLKAQSPQETFREVADALSSVKSQYEKVAIAKEIFGKTGAEAIEFIDSLKQAQTFAASLGTTLSEKDVAALDSLSDSGAEASEIFKELKDVFAAGVVSGISFTDMIREMAPLIQLAAVAARLVGETVGTSLKGAMIALEAHYKAALALKEKLFGSDFENYNTKGTSSQQEEFFRNQSASTLNYLGGKGADSEMDRRVEAGKEKLPASIQDLEAKNDNDPVIQAAKKKREEQRKEFEKLHKQEQDEAQKMVEKGLKEGEARDRKAASDELQTQLKIHQEREQAKYKIVAEGAKTGKEMLDALARKTIEDNKKRIEAEAATFKGTLKSAFGNLPQVIMGAIQGGGNVLSAIGSSLGASIFGKDSNLTKSLTAGASKLFGDSIGKSLGSILPGIGALAGPILGKIGGFIGGLFGPSEAKKTDDMRKKFIETAGGLEELQKKAKDAHYDLDKLFHAGKIKDFEAEVAKLNTALDSQKQAQQAVKDAMDRWGLSAHEMGAKFEAEQLHEQFASMLQDWKVLEAQGADMAVVAAKMAPSMNEWLQSSLAAGTAIPESMRPVLEKMIEMGLLTDAAGNKMTSLEGVNFTESLENGIRGVIDAINALVVALGGVPTNLPPIDIPINAHDTGNGGANGPTPGDYQQQNIPTHALGTPKTREGLAYLHDDEAVLPAAANPWAGGNLSALDFKVPSLGFGGGGGSTASARDGDGTARRLDRVHSELQDLNQGFKDLPWILKKAMS